MNGSDVEQTEPAEVTHLETKIFPVTKRVADEGLKANKLDPESDIARELEFMRNTNRGVYDFLETEAGLVGDPRFMHGAASVHKFLRIQAELYGGRLADVDMNPHVHSYMMGLKDKPEPDPGEVDRKWREWSVKEHHLIGALDKMTEHDPSGRFFKLGALEILNIFDHYRGAARIRKMVSRPISLPPEDTTT